MTAPNKPAPIPRVYVAPAPRLTKDGYCSDCQAKAVLAGGGQMKVCPKCYALLWHEDYSAEERRIRAERAAYIAAQLAEGKLRKHEAFVARQAARAMNRNTKVLSAKNISAPGPVLGMPTLTENKLDDVSIRPPEGTRTDDVPE